MELLYQYQKYLLNYSKTTQKTYFENVKLFLRYLEETNGKINVIVICNITKAEIYNYIAYMDNLSKNTKFIRLYSVKNFYTFVNQNLATFLFEDIKLYSFNKKTPRFLTLSQSKALLEYYTDKRNKLIIYLLLTTGIRVTECAEIKIENIDLKEKIIKCRCKGGIDRNIIINEQCKQMIKNYKGRRKRGYLFGIKSHDIQYIVKKALINLGFKGSTHTLRHTAATLIYQSTKDILVVQQFLGHKSINSTQIYAHLNNDLIKQAVNSNPLANYRREK